MEIAGRLMDRGRRWMPYVACPGLGLYLVRGLAEVTRVTWPLGLLWTLALLAGVLGLGVAWFVNWRPRTCRINGITFRPDPHVLSAQRAYAQACWVFLPLWVYVFWPRRDPAVAWGVGLITVFSALLGWLQGRDGWARVRYLSLARALDIGVFVASLTLYWLTLAPGLQAADEGEFQLVAARFGVAHPPGYPLYTLLGGLFARLPLGHSPAWRLNLFSALTAAVTVMLVGRMARQMTGRMVAGLVAALTLSGATTFWATATRASIRPCVAFFAALMLYALTEMCFEGQVGRFTWRISRPTFFATALGLGVSHHPSLIFVGAVGAVYLVLVDPDLLRRPRRWLTPALALILTQSVWLYLPLRDAAGAPLAPGNLTMLKGLLDHVLARGFAGDMFALATSEHLPDRVALLPTLMRFQLPPLSLAAALLGAVVALWRDWRRFFLLTASFALHTFVTLTYRAPQTLEYEMPAFIVLALLVAQVVDGPMLWQRWGGRRTQISRWIANGGTLMIALTLLAGLLNVVAGWASFRDLARRDDARTYAESLLETAPEGAMVLSNWHWATPMWYLQQVEGLRPDVTVKYVAPQGTSLAQNWVEAIEQWAARRPTVVVRYFEPEYEDLPYRFAPWGPAWIVQTGPTTALPPEMAPLNVELGGQIRLLGYACDDQAALLPGQPLVLTLAWTPCVSLEGTVGLFAHLLREGALVGQGVDRQHVLNDYQPGEIVLDRFYVYPLIGVMPGEMQLAVGAYRPDTPGAPRLVLDDGADYVPVTPLDLRAADFVPVSSRPRRMPFVDGPTLAGIDWDTTVTGRLRLYLHWQGGTEPVALDAAIYQGEAMLAQAQVNLPEGGYVSAVYDLPPGAGSYVLVTSRDAVGPWGVSSNQIVLPDPRPDERYVPVGGEMVLMGAAVNRRDALASGAHLSYDLRLVAAYPLLRDRIVSVSLVGLNPDESWAWRVASDGVPALGAMPTFKWIHGSMILDRHRLTVPGSAPQGGAQAWLGIYDHYTQAILPPLDLHLLRQGVSIPLHSFAVSSPPGE